jgi:hypothetical protein
MRLPSHILCFISLSLMACRGNLKRLPIEGTASTPEGLSIQKMPGTNLYVHVPDGFVIDSAQRLLAKGSTASLRFVYAAGENLYDPVAQLQKEAESKTGLSQHFYYDVRYFTLNGLQARMYYSPSDKPGKDRLLLILSNKLFSAGAIADFPSGNQELKDTLLHSLLSISAADPTPADIARLEPFTMDLTSSEFAYCNQVGLAFFYTIGGVPNPGFGTGIDQFMVAAPRPRNGESLQKNIKEVLQLYHSAQLSIQIYSVRPTYVREYPAYELEGKVHYHGAEGKIYLLVMGDSMQSLIFSALLYNNISHRLNEAIYIAHSLQFKQMISN